MGLPDYDPRCASVLCGRPSRDAERRTHPETRMSTHGAIAERTVSVRLGWLLRRDGIVVHVRDECASVPR